MLRQRAERFSLLTQSGSAKAELQAAANAIERPLDVFIAGNSREIDVAFASMAQKRIDALVVDANIPFINHRVQISTLAASHRLPTIHPWRDAAEAGGLIELRNESSRPVSPGRHLYRPHPQGREARRTAGAAADQ